MRPTRHKRPGAARELETSLSRVLSQQCREHMRIGSLEVRRFRIVATFLAHYSIECGRSPQGKCSCRARLDAFLSRGAECIGKRAAVGGADS